MAPVTINRAQDSAEYFGLAGLRRLFTMSRRTVGRRERKARRKDDKEDDSEKGTAPPGTGPGPNGQQPPAGSLSSPSAAPAAAPASAAQSSRAPPPSVQTQPPPATAAAASTSPPSSTSSQSTQSLTVSALADTDPSLTSSRSSATLSSTSLVTNDDPSSSTPTTATVFLFPSEPGSTTILQPTTLLPPPTPVSSPYSLKDQLHNTEHRALTGVAAIFCVLVFFLLAYALFRFCPPVRNRWTAVHLRYAENRAKRLGIESLPAERRVTATPAIARSRPGDVTEWTRNGPGRMALWPLPNAAARRLGVGTNADGGAGLRPPSYRSARTASGASWVANGFRLPERLSQRFRRSGVGGSGIMASGGLGLHGRSWFGRSDGPNRSSLGSEGDTDAGTDSLNQSEGNTSVSARVSTMSSGSQVASRNRRYLHDDRSSTGATGTTSTPRTRAVSQMTEVSRMSSAWSEQRTSVALAPPLPVRVSSLRQA